jgi:hypothetical protein
MKSSNMPE